MAETLLTKFDLNKFLWKPLPGREGRTRLLMGAESILDVMNRYVAGYGEHSLFFAAYVDLESPAAKADLEHACRNAWIWLRYDVPTIASRIVVDEQDFGHLEYEVPTLAELDEWAGRTFIVTEQRTLDLSDLRCKMGRNKIPSDNGDKTWLHLVCGPSDSDEEVRTFGLLLRSHHAPYDGPALKIIINRYLAQLAKMIASSEGGDDITGTLNWGKEVDNLVPAAVNILSSSEPVPIPLTSTEEPTFAHPCYASLGSVVHGLGAFYQDAYGYKPRQHDTRLASNAREEIVFSKQESNSILKSLKSSSGAKYTLTHLAHAALALTVISDNPPTASDSHKFLNNYSFADRRDFLRDNYSASGRGGYPGYGGSVNVMRIPVSTFLSQDGSALPANKETLVKAMRVIRDAYMAEKAIPAPLGYMAQMGEACDHGIRQLAAANMPLPANQNFALSSGGRGEKYLDHTYMDDAGNDVLKVTRFFSALNRCDPGPFYHLSSWRGIIDFAADFNTNVTPVEDVKKYMKAWKEYMLLVAEFEEGDY